MRPRSLPLFRSRCRFRESGSDQGGSITSRYMSEVKRAVRGVSQLHRTKPVVRAGQELDFLFVHRALRSHRDTIRANFFSVNEVAAAVGDESIAHHVFGERVAAIDRDARG